MGGGGKKFVTRKKGINQSQLGKAIWNSAQKRLENGEMNREHLLDVICDNYDEMNNKSIVEMSNLDEYLSTSLRAQENFEEEKVIRIISAKEASFSNRDLVLRKERISENVVSLPIPRRPMILVGPNCRTKRAPEMNYLEDLEKESFLGWRKSIAEEEESTGLFVTPFEKNLEFWRQLWRTIERSHVIVEIIDSRDPLFFRNTDLEKYINEVDPLKKVVLLFNKADFLSLELRREWVSYFKSTAPNLHIFFFSALDEINKRETIGATDSDYSNLKEVGECDVLTTQQLLYKLYRLAMEVFEASTERYLNWKDDFEDFNDDTTNMSEGVLGEQGTPDKNRTQLSYLKARSDGPGIQATSVPIDPLNPGEMTIGMVGFPNVGKSSIVNALFGSQKSSISRTPGKTKHLQTLKLKVSPLFNEKGDGQNCITLCDCPGLVMPSFTSTKEHLLVNGVTPIDHFRGNFLDTIQLIGERIPAQLYRVYLDETNTKIPKRFDSTTFLNKLCETRHLFQQGKGAIPDWSKAGRMILRDYWSGKLLYCHSPPSQKRCFDPKDKSAASETRGSSPCPPKMDDENLSESNSEEDILILKSTISKEESPPTKDGRKTKRQVRMEQKRLIKGKTVCYS
ncbi:putative ribosome biogenesis GTPase Lsg1 [Cryptosporidium felis]|nr:putative ribosome biogenesis GTPase Lsg1 [Cryptosporidium felis]